MDDDRMTPAQQDAESARLTRDRDRMTITVANARATDAERADAWKALMTSTTGSADHAVMEAAAHLVELVEAREAGRPLVGPTVADVPPHLRGAISPERWKEIVDTTC